MECELNLRLAEPTERKVAHQTNHRIQMETASLAQMADEPNIQRHRQAPMRRSIPATVQEEEEEEEEFYNHSSPFAFEFDSFSPPNISSNPAFFDDYAAAFDLGFELEAENHEQEGSNGFFFGGEEDHEQMNFVSDLFERRHAYELEDPGLDVNSGWEEESTTEFEFGSGIGFCTGLRLVGINSESDSEEFEVNAGFINHDDANYDSFEISNNHHRFSEIERDEFEWEEVSERILVDNRENLNSVINRIEEISVSSDISSSVEENTNLDHDESAEEVQNTEWEVLLAMSNIERILELTDLEENNPNGSQGAHLDLPGDYILTMEHNTLFGQLVENENTSKGSPPAARLVVENLPWTVLTQNEIVENKVVSCAVCKDEFIVGEKVTLMPCCHMYHGGCILPWLSIRNTCPVCRYELPTDDADYEKRRSGIVGRGLAADLDEDLRVRYNFEVLPL